nr:PREDICTED: uncharacterized protein LOC102693182 isoform X1 [Lepisosteus oculatus]XP_015224339.1 PREDICTED: uncharacterized protein LOC102693182 isoform X1 [Lepisosteus oculatus]
MDPVSQVGVAMELDEVSAETVMGGGVGAEVELQEEAENGDAELSVGQSLISQCRWDQPSLLADSSEEEDYNGVAERGQRDGCRGRGERRQGQGSEGGGEGAGGRTSDLDDIWNTSPSRMAGGAGKDGSLCWECGKSFATLEQLVLHFKAHKAEMVCNVCRITFRRVVSLRLHLANVHSDLPLRCPCGQALASLWALNQHLASHPAHYATQLQEVARLEKKRLNGQPPDGFPCPDSQQGSPKMAEPGDEDTSVSPPRLGEGPGALCTTYAASSAGDHTYNESDGGAGHTRTYAIRMRHTKMVTLGFSPEDLPEEARKKKLQIFMFRNVGLRRSQGGEEEEEDEEETQVGKGAGAERVPKEEEQEVALSTLFGAPVEEDDDIKPDVSSLVPPLPSPRKERILVKPGVRLGIKQESPSSSGDLSSSLASKREEERDALEEDSSDGGDSLPPGDSDFNPEGLSGASSDSSNPSSSSCSSGNSSGSSYRPRKRRRTRKARRMPTRAANGSRSAPTKGAGPAQSGSSHCEQCGGRLHQSAYFRFRHMFCCSQRKKTKYPCADCSSTFPTELALLDHKAKIHHCHTVRMYACESCREVFPDCVVFRRHTCPGKATISPAPLRTPIPSLGSPVSAPTPGTSVLPLPAIQSQASLPSNQISNPPTGMSTLTLNPSSTTRTSVPGTFILAPTSATMVQAPLDSKLIVTSASGIAATLAPVLSNSMQGRYTMTTAPAPLQGNTTYVPVVTSRIPVLATGNPIPAPSSAIPASIQGSAILTPVPGNPFPSSIQGSAILTTVHGNPRTVPIQGSAILTPVPGNQITASIQRSTILTSVPGNPIPASIQGSAILTPVLGNPKTASIQRPPAPGSAIPTPIQGTAILAPVPGNHIPAPIQGSTILASVRGNPVPAPIQRSAILTPVPGNLKPSPIQGTAILTPVQSNPKPAPLPTVIAQGTPQVTPLQSAPTLAATLSMGSTLPRLPLPGVVLPSSGQEKSGTQPMVATLVFSNDITGNRVARVVFQTQTPTVQPQMQPGLTVQAVPQPPAPSPQPLPHAKLPNGHPRPPQEPLKILALYASRGQGQRPAERGQGRPATFKCRECGASSRQPSLGICHRYLHRGWRGYRCPCGRVFVRRLHLLRHQVQHAEATRFVCAPCGRTFSGAQRLARHKMGKEEKGGRRERRLSTQTRPDKKRKRRRKGVARACRAPFTCDCGQPFRRPAAFMWHKIQNTRPLRRPARASVPVSGISSSSAKRIV